MRPAKAFLKNPWAQRLSGRLVALYVRLVWRTTRWTVEPSPAAKAVTEGGGPVIACLWHGRMLLTMPIKPPDRPVHILISSHRDGLLISGGMKRLGMETVAGSSRRGGVSALRQMTRILGDSGIVVITPDGPRGPRMRAKAGAVKTAQLSRAPIVPLGAATSRGRALGSWDCFWLPYPFGRGVILLGDPILVPREASAADLEQARGAVESAMNRLTADAERRCGRVPIEPAAKEACDARA